MASVASTYPITERMCPTCDKTLVAWRPATEPEQRVRRWWELVNFHTGIKRALLILTVT